MKFMGSKRRIAKKILPIMLPARTHWWVEPFVGGGNMIEHVSGKRLGADLNPWVIRALRFIRDTPEAIPSLVTEEMYTALKENLEPTGVTAYVGYALSFGGKWFGGYRRDKRGQAGCLENMKVQSRRARKDAQRQSALLKGTVLLVSAYDELDYPDGSTIYCDPPYAATTGYGEFDHDAFWQWCVTQSNESALFISEYAAPEGFVELWSASLPNTLPSQNDGSTATEKLFAHESVVIRHKICVQKRLF